LQCQRRIRYTKWLNSPKNQRYRKYFDRLILDQRQFRNTIAKQNIAQRAVCNTSTLTIGAGFDTYTGLDVSLSSGLSFNPRNVQIVGNAGVGAGIGVGPSANLGAPDGSNKAQPTLTAGL
jgi:hypothetical protein